MGFGAQSFLTVKGSRNAPTHILWSATKRDGSLFRTSVTDQEVVSEDSEGFGIYSLWRGIWHRPFEGFSGTYLKRKFSNVKGRPRLIHGVLLGPTGGYLVGFIVGAYIMGKLIEMKERPGFIWMASAMIIGHGVLYALGVVQLMLMAKLSLGKAFAVGVIPTLPGGIVKILAAAFIAGKLRDKIRMPVTTRRQQG